MKILKFIGFSFALITAALTYWFWHSPTFETGKCYRDSTFGKVFKVTGYRYSFDAPGYFAILVDPGNGTRMPGHSAGDEVRLPVEFDLQPFSCP